MQLACGVGGGIVPYCYSVRLNSFCFLTPVRLAFVCLLLCIVPLLLLQLAYLPVYCV